MYYGDDTLSWSDGKVRVWRLGVHFYFNRGLRVVGQDLDLNGDGLKDVVMTNDEWWYVYPYQHVFLNTDGRAFSPVYWQYREKSDSMCHDAVWVGDLNANGIPDLVLSVMDLRDRTGLRVYYDYPWDTTRMVYLRAGSVETPYVADFNLDGYLDILAGVWRDSTDEPPNGEECSRIFYGSPSGYSQSDTSPCLFGGGTHPVFAADLDYDGDIDAFIGSLYYRGWFPPFSPPRVYLNSIGNFSSSRFIDVWLRTVGYDSSGVYGATVADLNRDGYLDVIGCAYNRGVVLYGSDSGYTPLNRHDFLSLMDCRNVQAYDINGDGWIDVIFGEKAPYSDWRNGRITIYLNDGGNFNEADRIVIPSPSNYGILVMDLDDDGWPDIVSSRKELDTSQILWNLGTYPYYDTTVSTPLHSVKASRNLSVQIFGNIYDRRNRFGYLSKEIKLLTPARLQGVKIYGDFAGQGVRLYVRGYDGRAWSRWFRVEDGEGHPLPAPKILKLQFRMDVHTNFAGTSKFHVDSLIFRFDRAVSVAESPPPCETGLEVKAHSVKVKDGRLEVYTADGRRIYAGAEAILRRKGTYFVVVRKCDGGKEIVKVTVR